MQFYQASKLTLRLGIGSHFSFAKSQILVISSAFLAAEVPQNASTAATVTPAAVQTTASLPETTLAPSYQAPIGITPRGSGIEANQLPLRFRRRPIDEEEIEYIQVCNVL